MPTDAHPFALIEQILKRLPKDHVGSANFAVLSLMEYQEKHTASENVIKENNMKVFCRAFPEKKNCYFFFKKNLLFWSPLNVI